MKLRFHPGYFLLALMLFVIEVLIGDYMHDAIIRPYGGDFLVVILIYCTLQSFFSPKALPALVGVLLFAYVVEVSQYFHIINYLGLEKSNMARLIMGTSFAWTDLLAYTLGILLVALVEYKIGNIPIGSKSLRNKKADF